MTLKNKDYMVIGLAAIILLVMTGYITLPKLGQQGTPAIPTSGTTFPANPTVGQPFYRTDLSQNYVYTATGWQTSTTPPVIPPIGTTMPDAQPYLEVVNSVTKAALASTTTAYVDVFRATSGQFDFLNRFDSFVMATEPDAGNSMIPDGSALVFHCSETANPTSGLDHYDTWFYAIAHVGNTIYALDSANFVVASTVPYRYTINTAGATPTGYTVSWTSGTTPYWNFGKLYVHPRTALASMNMVLQYSTTTLSSVANGATWVTTGSTANATLAGKSEHIQMALTFDDVSNGWGYTMLAVGSAGQINTYKSIIMFTTNMTAIDQGQLQAEGWSAISDSVLYAEKAFYTTIDACVPTAGQKAADKYILIPVYSTAAATSTMYTFKFWVMDLQQTVNVGQGSTTIGVPTAYGVSQIGPGIVIHGCAFTVAAGIGATQQLQCFVTTSS